jgi:hypothetical protein
LTIVQARSRAKCELPVIEARRCYQPANSSKIAGVDVFACKPAVWAPEWTYYSVE